MIKLPLSHELNCTPEIFWKIFFDQEFNSRLYLDYLGFPEFKNLEQRETETQTIRKVMGQPKMNMPAPVMKLLGSNFRYTEDGTLDKATMTWRWKLTPSALADKLRNEGTLRCEPVGDRRCRRIVELVMEAKVFGLGGLLESSTEKQMREGWDKSAVFMNKWIAENGLAANAS